MANIWLSQSQMNALFPEEIEGEILLADGTYQEVTFTRQGSYVASLGGNNTNLVVDWFTADTPPDQHGRIISRYNANVSGLSLPSDPVQRRIKFKVNFYTTDVTFLDFQYLNWIDIGAAQNVSYESYNEATVETYRLNGVDTEGYVLPSTARTAPGITRIDNNAGVTIFRNKFELETPAAIDFFECQYSCVYSENNTVSFWITQPEVNEEAQFPDSPTPEDDPGDWGDPSEKTGGHGTFTAVSDNSGDGTGAHAAQVTQNWNTATAVAGNFYNLYRFNGPNDQALLEMAASLWGKSFIESFTNTIANPLSAIVSFHLIPEKFAPPLTGVTKRVYAGIKNLSTTTARTFTDLMATYHFGPYNLDQFYDGFGDFEPYTELYIHLPYVGVYPIDLSACMGGQLSVDYYCDRLTGDCAAIIWVKDKYGNYRTRYEYKGNCARPLPIAQFSSSAAMGLISGGLGIIESAIGLAIGNPALVRNGATYTGEAIPQLMNNKFTVSNVSQGGATTPSDTTIYLIVVRKLWNNPNRFQNLIGLPSDVSGTINSSDYNQAPFTGFLSVRTVDVDMLDATDEEKAEVVSLMTEGIYV